jgi:hypothetical protein
MLPAFTSAKAGGENLAHGSAFLGAENRAERGRGPQLNSWHQENNGCLYVGIQCGKTRVVFAECKIDTGVIGIEALEHHGEFTAPNSPLHVQ